MTTKMNASTLKKKILNALPHQGRPVTLHTLSPAEKNRELWKELSEEQKSDAQEYWKGIEKGMRGKNLIPWHTYAVLRVKGSKLQLYNPHGNGLSVDIDTLAKFCRAITIGPKIK